VTKQTGPAQAVKARMTPLGALRWARCFAFASLALAACSSGGWTNPDKSKADAQADMQTCEKQSEEDALERSGHARADYGMPPGGPMPGGAGTAGPSPMQMHDHDAVAHDYHNAYDSCMESKGYTHGKGAP
jgi:hypothetical protein